MRNAGNPENRTVAKKNKLIRDNIIEESSDDLKKRQIVHKHIKEVHVFNEPKGVKRIQISFYIYKGDLKTHGVPRIYYYAGMKKDKSKQLYYMVNDIPHYIEFENRFER